MNISDSKVSIGYFSIYRRVYYHLSRQKRKQFLFLAIVIILATFSEFLSIASIVPFLGALTTPEKIMNEPFFGFLIQIFEITTSDRLVFLLSIFFVLVTIFSAFLRLFVLWLNTRFSFSAGADLGIDIYKKTLYQPYIVHCMRNSSEVINGISNKTNGVVAALNTVLSMISAFLLTLAIFIPMLIFETKISLITFLSFGTLYGAIILFTKKRLYQHSLATAVESGNVLKTLQEGLGGIRDILIDGTQNAFANIFHQSDLRLKHAQAQIMIIGNSPRVVIETIAIVLIMILAYKLTNGGQGITEAIAPLGTIAFGSQRLLPLLQQLYHAWVGIRSSQASLTDALDLLDQPMPDYMLSPSVESIDFNKSIRFDDVQYSYPGSNKVTLEQFSLEIPKGMKLGIIGSTGSGKSTFLDIFMGLLIPENGKLSIDDKTITPYNVVAWQKNLVHVPQSIFLADCTISENIAFGISKDKIDQSLVIEAAKKAHIHETILTWEKGYQTVIGERGIRISGGQRQRIGIARALYKKANVIVFDEATSALDFNTEESIMKSIDELGEDVTILLVAHRISTLKNCDLIIKIENGRIVKSGKYDEMV